ncbi:threonine/serine exporter family protein [Staphylococcus massiliensis]|uniref:threonine/serine exporter family protein n=1 Tax=Staphylococcus massiliensis TaxID=555791 RepID=UPI001EDE1D0E|nr:threonine/serine exporter family protein [Staphylococcus massiliensis]MCG3401923.1 threonine/serine exporter family protein [Staphylococcus massiliensis]
MNNYEHTIDNVREYVSHDEEMIKDVILLAGRILLESGAEGTRVEDTMSRIASTLGYASSNSFVTNIVITFHLHKKTYPRVYRIKQRDTNLLKISQTNTISRKIAEHKITLEEAKEALEHIYNNTRDYNLLYKTLASGVIALSFLYLQGGSMVDLVATIIAGALGFFVTESSSKILDTQFISEFCGSVVIALCAVISHYFFPEGSIAVIIIAAVMPIVPGVLITNAIQDLFGGHMLMFATKSLEALATSFAIGAGVATVLILS